MGEVANSRFSMRSLRSSLASSSLGSTRAVRQVEPVTAYTAVPSQKLNLVDVQFVSSSGRPGKERERKVWENSRQRKRRQWRERLDQRRGERPPVFTDWMFLPDLVLEHIFKFLSYKERVSAGLACSQWWRVFWNTAIWSHITVTGNSMCSWQYSIASRDYEDRHYASLACSWWSKVIRLRSVWQELTIRDTTLTRWTYNYGSSRDEPKVDTMRVSNALNAIGEKLKCLSFRPHENLHNIVTFQEVICRWCNMNRRKLPNIKCFTYVFPCDFAKTNNEVEIYGTGGMILQNMKDLLHCLPGLERLELVDLQLDGEDGEHVLDEVSEVCYLSLKCLKIVNITRSPLSMMMVSSFSNLRCLILSPHNLGDDLVENIAKMPKLRNLEIVSNAYSECVPTPVDYRIWKQCRKIHPRLRVHLVTEGKHKKEMTFQTRAPVKSLVYNTPYSRANQYSINLAIELYKTDLEVYCHQGLPRFSRSKSFHERPDSSYLYLIRQCPYIHTLMIRERISSSTVLLLAYTGKNIRYFHIRRNAILLKCDWPKSPDWSTEFYTWLRKNSKSYSDLEREVSQILGFRWYLLNDKQFKLTHVNLNLQYYYEGFEEAD